MKHETAGVSRMFRTNMIHVASCPSSVPNLLPVSTLLPASLSRSHPICFPLSSCSPRCLLQISTSYSTSWVLAALHSLLWDPSLSPFTLSPILSIHKLSSS
eukprot:GHVS01037824.1.p1 GENE.GHVS01037824.1~~GHVS01037824.1.p1  ORF type:complete len:101 (-),score=13.95 GHVS01037824.1:281-583(-)